MPLLPLALWLLQLVDPYPFLNARNYEAAIPAFVEAIKKAPAAHLHKDLAYTYLKIGENEPAKEQFRAALRLEPDDDHTALELAFLCHETREEAEARRIFDRIRKKGNATAEQAFQNVDRPLAVGIDRWKAAIGQGADNFSAHHELARLAEQRDELELAAAHYERAWRLLPERRSVLVELGRVWKAQGRSEEGNAALLAASRGGEAHAAEAARRLLPARYPWVSEFRRALDLDPQNTELRRELGFLLLRMDRVSEAEEQFKHIAGDPLAAAQLGFLLLARGDRERAIAVLEPAIEAADEELANRVRAVLRLPQVVRQPPQAAAVASDAKSMAERSIQAGYLRDALKYLLAAHDADPADSSVIVNLGWTYNMLRQDREAIRWFALGRRSADARLAAEADRAFRNLRPSLARIRTTAWMFPLYSSRWRDLFSYAQFKTELRLGLPVTPYFSTRFIGDSRRNLPGSPSMYLSESSFIPGLGLAAPLGRGVTAWGEAGFAISYLNGHVLPDYRGGLAVFRSLTPRHPRWFAESSADALFVSRFNNDFLLYSQTRAGYRLPGLQVFWNANVTADTKREYWANFAETGPGIRVPLATTSFFTFSLLRGAYTRNAGNPYRPNYNDFRAGVWYAFTY